MSLLFQKIQTDLIEAQKAQEEVRVSTLRYLISFIKNREIELRPSGKELTDDEVISVLGKQVKQRNESIVEYRRGNREDLARKEENELEILKTYLPEQLSEEEAAKLVEAAVSQAGARTPADIGRVMGVLMPQVKGRIDSAVLSNLIKAKLGGA